MLHRKWHLTLQVETEEQDKLGDREHGGIKGLLYLSRCSEYYLPLLENRRGIPTEVKKAQKIDDIILAEADAIVVRVHRNGMLCR